METKLQVEIKKLIDRYTSKSLFGMPMYHEEWIVGDLNSLLKVADAEAKEPVKVAIQQRGQIIIKNQFTGKETIVTVNDDKFYWHEESDLKQPKETNAFYGKLQNEQVNDFDIPEYGEEHTTGHPSKCLACHNDKKDISEFDKQLVEAYAEVLKPALDMQSKLLDIIQGDSKAMQALKLMTAPHYMNMTDAIKKVEGEL